MKKFLIFCVSVLIANNAWAAGCSLTSDMPSGSEWSYDEWLYFNTGEREKRKEGKDGEGFLCWDGYCTVGTKKYYRAAVGNSETEQAVYECKNLGSDDRTNFNWVKHTVQQTCVVDDPAKYSRESDIKLFKVGNYYCDQVVKIDVKVKNKESEKKGKGWVDLLISWGNNTVEIAKNATNGTIEILKNAGNVPVSIVGETLEFTGGVIDGAQKTTIATLKILKGGTVSLVENIGNTAVAISGDIHNSFQEALRTAQEALKTVQVGMQEAGATTRTAIEETGATTRTAITEGAGIVSNTVSELNETARSGLKSVLDTGLAWDKSNKDFVLSAGRGAGQFVLEWSQQGYNFTAEMANGAGKLITTVSGQAFELGECVVDSTGKVIVTLSNNVKDMYGDALKTTRNITLGAMKIGTDGLVQIANISGGVIKTISDNTTEAYKATLQFLSGVGGNIATTAQKFLGSVDNLVTQGGENFRTLVDNWGKVTVTGISSGKDLLLGFAGENTARFKIAGDVIKSVSSDGKEVAIGTVRTLANGAVQIFDNAGKNMVGGLQVMTDGAVKIFDSTNKTVQTIAKSGTDAYKATLEFFGNRLNSFDENIRTAIKSAADAYKVTINAARDVALQAITSGENIVTTAMNNAKDFANNFVNRLTKAHVDMSINENRLKKLESEIAKCTTQEQVADMIQAAMREANLNETQRAEVNKMIEDALKEVGVTINRITGRLTVLENAYNTLKGNLAKLYSNQQAIWSQLETKTTPEEVLKLIEENTQDFTEGQLKELKDILDKYTEVLSSGQKSQVEDLIAKYVDPRISAVNKRIDDEAKRREAMDKLTVAMSTLNAFQGSADVSVWKTAEGNFNGARLASDATAGVVLGTAGGLISNAIIKKNQLKSGFEDITCTVGGQVVAGYGDEFVVGMF